MLAEAKGKMLGVGEGSEISCLLILSPSSIRNESRVRLMALPPWSWQATLPSFRSEIMPTPRSQSCSGTSLCPHAQGTLPHQSPRLALAPSLWGC